MTQDQLYILLLKIGIVAAILSLAGWTIVYSRLQPWWRDHIGINLVGLAIISMGQLTFLGLAVFFSLNRNDSRVIAWSYTVFTLAITPLMVWRTIMWVRLSREIRRSAEPEPCSDHKEPV